MVSYCFSIYSIVFPLSTIPYLLFLRGLWKQKTVPVVSKLGFTYLLVFVFFSIIGSIAAMTWYHESLSNVDWIHGWAEQFLSVTVVTIYLGYRLAWNECLKEEELEEREE
eukprot:jgi/Galph1/1576/GphlegSOOS_G271.1